MLCDPRGRIKSVCVHRHGAASRTRSGECRGSSPHRFARRARDGSRGLRGRASLPHTARVSTLCTPPGAERKEVARESGAGQPPHTPRRLEKRDHVRGEFAMRTGPQSHATATHRWSPFCAATCGVGAAPLARLLLARQKWCKREGVAWKCEKVRGKCHAVPTKSSLQGHTAPKHSAGHD